MQNLFKALDVLHATVKVASDLLTALEILSYASVRSAIEQKDLKSCWESEKKSDFWK